MRYQRSCALLEGDPAILEVAKILVEPGGPLPRKAGADALHIASASVYGCDFLLTWNYKHIANAMMKRRIERILKTHGYEPPTICTPAEFMGWNEDEVVEELHHHREQIAERFDCDLERIYEYYPVCAD